MDFNSFPGGGAVANDPSQALVDQMNAVIPAVDTAVDQFASSMATTLAQSGLPPGAAAAVIGKTFFKYAIYGIGMSMQGADGRTTEQVRDELLGLANELKQVCVQRLVQKFAPDLL